MSSTKNPVEAVKVTPKAKIVVEKAPTAMERVQNLEACIAKMAHYNGSQSILLEFGIPKWNPEAKDMRKYRG